MKQIFFFEKKKFKMANSKKGNFLIKNKKKMCKMFSYFFQRNLTYSIEDFYFQIVHIFYYQILIFGPDISVKKNFKT